MGTPRRSLLHALACVGLLAAAGSSGAFSVVPVGAPGEYLKWGASRLAGTPGGVVTWGFVAPGTEAGDFCAPYCQGRSLAALPNFYASPQRGNDTTAVTLASLRPVFQAAFDAWSAVADLEFRYVGAELSLEALDAPVATPPMIRIGIWRFAGLHAYFVAGAAFPPRLRSGSGAGHVFINSNVGFQLSDRPEDSRLQDFPVGGGLYMTELRLLALHEIGHVIGLAGSADADAVMWQAGGSAALTRSFAWRRPRPDDIAGAQFLYGAPRPSAGQR